MTERSAQTPPTPPPPPESDVEARAEQVTQNADLSWVTDVMRELRDEILERWLSAASDQPFHSGRSELAISDHVPALFDALGRLMAEYVAREQNGAPLEDPDVLAAAQSHARMRFEQGFEALDVVTEFRLLRQEIGRALSTYVSDHSPTSDVVGAELLLYDALDGAAFLALTALSDHELLRRKAELALRESEERFRLLVESVEDYAIFTIAADGSVASWNAGAQRTLGHDREAIVGQPVAVLFTDEDRADGVPERLLATAQAEGRAIADGERQRADGSRFHTDASLTASCDDGGTLLGFTMVMHDVTERRRIADQQTVAAREREAFLATLGHDLKSPLTSASAAAQLLRRRATAGRLDPDQLVDGLSSIEAAVRHGALRVDELMDLARMDESEAPALQPEPLDLVALVDSVLDGYRIANDRHEFVWKPGADSLQGVWDRDRIERVIDNLVSNAVKFSPDGGRIAASVAMEGTARAPEAVVTVSDQGLGIPESERALIFARFRRGSNADGVPGSGIGLWSVRRIVEQHGGRIDVTSRVGEGSTFTVRLPVTTAATESA